MVGLVAARNGAVLLMVGLALFPQLFAAVPDTRGRRHRWLLGGAAAVAILLTALHGPLQAMWLGGTVAAALDPGLLGMVAGSGWGVALLMLAAGVVLVGLTGSGTRPRGWPGWGGLALGVALSLGALGRVGHTTGSEWGLPSALLMLHLLGLAIWLGALVPLWWIVAVRGAGDAATILDRFGWRMQAVLPVLLLAGIGLAWLLLGEPSALWRSDYGRVLTVKLAVVGLLLLLAALNRFRWVPKLAAGKRGAGRHLQWSIAVEGGAMAAILLLTAVLVTLSPPA